MLAWRLCRRPHADISGEGARKFGGRWNSPGRAVVYLAEHPALAALEVRVHLDLPFDLLPADYVLLSVSVPDGSIGDTTTATEPMATGNAWLAARETAALRVPSILVPHAFNILLNPLHPAAADATIASVEPFRFDPRLWQPLGHE
jgi:RES domain-containing protein